MSDQAQGVLGRLQAMGDPEDAAGMARFGINIEKAYGIRIPELRKLAKELGKDHQLALELWDSGMHEARILASMLDDPKQVTEDQMEAWVSDFNSWDLCDQCCGNLFDKTPYAYDKVVEWSARPEEFIKRAGFALLAWLALHDKVAPDEQFESFLPLILREATDERNFVKKAVNWALRHIGKRNLSLNSKAIMAAEKMATIDNKAAKWNAKDALRELKSEKVQERLRKKEGKN
ncbi:MAG: DNA alkylation repair protein [Chloroflexi bacterium]|nr:DNA alkylation repair protein [Chloroflexota bacterium]